MRESGPRKRDEDGDDDEDDHRGDDSPPDDTPAPPRERRRGPPPCAYSSMASPLDRERFPLWSLAFMAMMAPPGSSSMASGDDGPLQRGAGEGLDCFLVATEACGGGTFDLGYFLKVWVFIGEVSVENKSGAPWEVHEAQGAP